MDAPQTIRSEAHPALPLRHGTAATEFVIILPLMLLIGIGCLDLGRAVQHDSVISNAASVGARCGATNRFFAPYTLAAWEANVRRAVQDELASLTYQGTPLADFDIRITTTAAAPSDDGNQNQPLPHISVTVDYDFETTFRWPGFPRRIPLHGESLIREYR